jgi:hypothetical protein
VRLTPDSRTILYRASLGGTPWSFSLFRAPADVSSDANRISGFGTNLDLGSGPDLFDFLVTPDGERVVYQLDQDTDGVVELYSNVLPRRHGIRRR